MWFLLFLMIQIQQQTQHTCTDAEFAAFMDAASTKWDDVQVMIDDGKIDDALNGLRGIKNGLAALDAVCYGLSFEGDDDTVLGPVNIPAGLYRMTMTSAGGLYADLTLLDGDCGLKTIAPTMLYILTSKGAPTGDEKIFESSGCNALIDLRTVDAPWTLTFERIKTS